MLIKPLIRGFELMKPFVNLVLIICLYTVAHSQNPEAFQQIDEFQNPNCEDLWARLDNFRIQINNNPDATAIVALSGKNYDLRNDLWYEAMIRTYFMSRKLPAGRWKVLRTQPQAVRKAEFWLTPAGGELPNVQVSDWSLEYSKETKPFIFTFGDSYAVETNVCLYADELALLARVLAANPSARTNVVLKVRSQKEYLRRKASTISTLVNDYAIRRHQIKIFKEVTHRPNPYGIHPTVEYWFVMR